MYVLEVPPVSACRSPCLAEDPSRGSWVTWGSPSLSPLPLRRWLCRLGWLFQATADHHYLWWYHGNSQPVFTDMGRYSLFPRSSSGPGAPNSHQWGGCFALTVTLHICNFPESLASVPNSPGILVFSRTKCYAYGLATVRTGYLLVVSLLNAPVDVVCR